METLLDKKTKNNVPSLLRQIVDEADMLDDEGKANVLWKIKAEKAIAKAREIDKKLEGVFKEMTEDEIAEMVSINRKKWYEEKLGH
jgi:hypothetical protein